MSNRRWREQFISDAARHGITYEDAARLLRYSATLHRLAEAQCNGDYPYANGSPWTDGMGDKAKARRLAVCERCNEEWATARMVRGSKCAACSGKGGAFVNDHTRATVEHHVISDEARASLWNTCEACRGRGCSLVCPDCRTTEKATAFVAALYAQTQTTDPRGPTSVQGEWSAQFQGDPRGCVFYLHRGAVIGDECRFGNCNHTRLGVPA